jgi:hypothetical protein
LAEAFDGREYFIRGFGPSIGFGIFIVTLDEGADVQSLALNATETRLLSDSAWACYEKDGDAEALAIKHAMFFRAVFTPTLASFLDAVRAGQPSASLAFADRLTCGLKCRLANDPSHINSLV